MQTKLVLPLLSLLACADATEHDPSELAEPSATDSLPQELALQRCPRATIFEPGKLSLPEAEESRIAFSPDGKTAFFGRGKEPWFAERRSTIYISERTRQGWSEPRVAPFSGRFGDIDPFVSPDGKRVYFSSVRPVNGEERTDADIWYVERVGSNFSEPVNLGASVNTRNEELYASVTASGDVYFASDRAGGFGGFDLYRTPRTGATAENLGPQVNTEHFEYNPWISPLGHLLVFASAGRPDSLGAGDFYGSIKLGGSWTTPKNLGPCVNSEHDEYHPVPVLREGKMFFIRHPFHPVWVPGDIYQVDLREGLYSLLGG